MESLGGAVGLEGSEIVKLLGIGLLAALMGEGMVRQDPFKTHCCRNLDGNCRVWRSILLAWLL